MHKVARRLHFWSLAVEEQFYFVWPILILLVLLLWKASSKRFSLQSALAIALALVLVPSFCWSVHHTSESPTEAFFETSTRLWELITSQTSSAGAMSGNETSHEGMVEECLLKHPEDATQCAFRRRSGERESAQGVQLKASKRFRRAQVVDLTDFICPGDKCAPVIGDVLVYRQGSHLTNTYARSLAPILGKKLKRAYDALHE